MGTLKLIVFLDNWHVIYLIFSCCWRYYTVRYFFCENFILHDLQIPEYYWNLLQGLIQSCPISKRGYPIGGCSSLNTMFFKCKSQLFLDILTFESLYTTFLIYFNIKKHVYHQFGWGKPMYYLSRGQKPKWGWRNHLNHHSFNSFHATWTYSYSSMASKSRSEMQ